MTGLPVLLFACIHNSGRSVAARVLAEHYAAGRVEAISAGSEPGEGINPAVAAVLRERGLSVESERPKFLDRSMVAGADVVVTMGCGETCPVFPGKHYEDWAVDDPKDLAIEDVRRIVDDIDRRVQALVSEVVSSAAPGRPPRGLRRA